MSKKKIGGMMSLRTLAEKSGRNMAAVTAWLELPVGERPFFAGAKMVEGEWHVPVLEAVMFLTSRWEPAFTGKQAATMLGISYPELCRRAVTTRAPKPGSEEIGAYFLGSRIRVPESEIVRIQTPSWRATA